MLVRTARMPLRVVLGCKAAFATRIPGLAHPPHKQSGALRCAAAKTPTWTHRARRRRNATSGALQCLPAFYILSPHQAGAKSLYSALTGHPGVAADHNAHTQYWSGEHLAMSQYVAEFNASARLVEANPGALIGDASEQTLSFYYAQNMKAHRPWNALVPACVEACARNASDPLSHAFIACARGCWRGGEDALNRVRGATNARGGRRGRVPGLRTRLLPQRCAATAV